MLTWILGIALALALVALLRARRRLFWSRSGGARPPVTPGGRFFFRGLFARLDTSPSQEQVLVDEASAIREELRALRSDWEALREELAALLGESVLDPAKVEAVLAAREERLASLRQRAAGAVARFHAVLDDAQRKTLAAMVREGHLPRPAHAHAWRRC